MDTQLDRQTDRHTSLEVENMPCEITMAPVGTSGRGVLRMILETSMVVGFCKLNESAFDYEPENENRVTSRRLGYMMMFWNLRARPQLSMRTFQTFLQALLKCRISEAQIFEVGFCK
jgi:hypothetical protein